MRRTAIRFGLVAIICAITSGGLTVHAGETLIGRQIDDFSLRDYRGKIHSLGEFTDNKLVVVAFLGTDCPLVKLYAPRLEELSKKYAGDGVAFIGINSNRQDTPTKIAGYARRYEISFPILKDPDNRIADAFGAVRTPEVFVLDRQQAVRYAGRIDDQYSVGISKPAVARNDLAVAIDELLAGKSVSEPVTTAPGCFIGRIPNVAPTGDVTYSNQISRILNSRCVECHRDGELAPFPLETYDDVVGWAETIREVVNDRRMPPWFADSQYGHFANDGSMSEEEIHLINQWVDNGYPEGDQADLPEPPSFVEGWRIGKPDAVYQMKKPFTVPAEGTIEYQHFLIDPGFEEDVWITDVEARPGNPSVVHHIVLFAVPGQMREFAERTIGREHQGEESRERDGKSAARRRRRRGGGDDGIGGGVSSLFGQIVGIYAPGFPPRSYPEGAAMKVQKGTLFVMQMHYTSNGYEQTDQSYVGLNFADPKTVKKRIRYGMALNMSFAIPPGDDNFVETSRVTFRHDSLLLSLFPHMHYRGKAFRYDAVYPDGTREVLLDVPRYDFNWQLRYDLAEPKLIPKGTRLECTATFDNSAENLANPDPTRTVRFGLQSWEEMLVGFYTHMPLEDDVAGQ